MTSSELYYIIIGIPYILVILVTMLCCIPFRKPVFDQESELERGMLVEVVRIHRDGNEIYSRDGTPTAKRLYDHPSFATSQRRLPSSKTVTSNTKSIKELRSELIQGMNKVAKQFE